MIMHNGVKYSTNSTNEHLRLSRELPGQWVGEARASKANRYSSVIEYAGGIYEERWYLDTLLTSVYRPGDVAELRLFNPMHKHGARGRLVNTMVSRMNCFGGISVAKRGARLRFTVHPMTSTSDQSDGFWFEFEREAVVHIDMVKPHTHLQILPFGIIDGKLVEFPSLPVSRAQRRRRVTSSERLSYIHCHDGRARWTSAHEALPPLQYDQQRRRFFAPWNEDQIDGILLWKTEGPLPSRRAWPAGLLIQP